MAVPAGNSSCRLQPNRTFNVSSMNMVLRGCRSWVRASTAGPGGGDLLGGTKENRAGGGGYSSLSRVNEATKGCGPEGDGRIVLEP